MKRRFCLIFAISLLLLSCAKTGALITPPNGVEQAVKDHLTNYNRKLNGLSVRAYPNDIYLVDADTEYLGKTSDNPKSTLKLVAQKGFKDGQEYWQIKSASKIDLENLQK